MEAPAGFRMNNTSHVYVKDDGGSDRSALTITSANSFRLNYGLWEQNKGTAYLYGRDIYLYARASVHTSVAITNDSDRRIKEGITDDLSKLDALLDHLRPVSYRLKTMNDGKRHIGLIAQEVEQAMIDAGINSEDFAIVTRANVDPDTDPDGLLDDGVCLGVTYEELIPILIGRVQTLTEEIKHLKGMIPA
jgi:hypothetical protein